MRKLTFLAGATAGYVLGSRAGRRRYEQIKKASGRVWHSGPVQKQVGRTKEAARTKAAPMIADAVATAAKETASRMRSSKTVSGETVAPLASSPSATTDPRADAARPWSRTTSTDGLG